MRVTISMDNEVFVQFKKYCSYKKLTLTNELRSALFEKMISDPHPLTPKEEMIV